MIGQRGGGFRYSLMVYRPGIEAHTRRRLRLLRIWPSLGAAAMFAVALLGSLLLPQPAPLVVAGLGYLAGFAVLGWLTAGESRRVRRIWAPDLGDDATLAEVGACARLQCLGDMLVDADVGLAEGRLTALEYELVWSTVYTELADVGRAGLGHLRRAA